MGLSVMSVFMCMWPCGGLVNCPGFKTYFIQWCAGIGCGPDTQIRKDKGRKELMNIVHLRCGKSSQNTLCGELSRVKSGNDSPKSLHSLQRHLQGLILSLWDLHQWIRFYGDPLLFRALKCYSMQTSSPLFFCSFPEIVKDTRHKPRKT